MEGVENTAFGLQRDDDCGGREREHVCAAAHAAHSEHTDLLESVLSSLHTDCPRAAGEGIDVLPGDKLIKIDVKIFSCPVKR